MIVFWKLKKKIQDSTLLSNLILKLIWWIKINLKNMIWFKNKKKLYLVFFIPQFISLFHLIKLQNDSIEKKFQDRIKKKNSFTSLFISEVTLLFFYL
jgi:hypothetical protein